MITDEEFNKCLIESGLPENLANLMLSKHHYLVDEIKEGIAKEPETKEARIKAFVDAFSIFLSNDPVVRFSQVISDKE